MGPYQLLVWLAWPYLVRDYFSPVKGLIGQVLHKPFNKNTLSRQVRCSADHLAHYRFHHVIGQQPDIYASLCLIA